MKKKPFSPTTIAAKIAKGKDFHVPSHIERQAALDAARFAGVKISTRSDCKGGYNVYFLK